MTICEILELSREQHAPSPLNENEWKTVEVLPPLTDDDRHRLALLHALFDEWDSPASTD